MPFDGAPPFEGGEVVVRPFDGVHLDGQFVFVDVVAEIFDGGGCVWIGQTVEHDAGQIGAEVRQMFFRRFLALRTTFDGGGFGGLRKFVFAVFSRLRGGAFFLFLVGTAFEKMAEDDVAHGFQGDVSLEETRPCIAAPKLLPIDA